MGTDAPIGEQMRAMVAEENRNRSPQHMFKIGYKVWPTQSHLTPVAEAAYIPSLLISTVSGSKTDVDITTMLEGKVSLLTVSMRVIGTDLGNTWRDAFEEHFPPELPENHDVQALHVSCYESFLYRLLRGHTTRKLKAEVEEHDHETFLMSYDKQISLMKDRLGIKSDLSAYVFLVDSLGRIRWKASGAVDAASKDDELMIKYASALLKEARGRSVSSR